jgi:hypothetical protein
MPSEADIRECERGAQQQRLDNARLFLRLDETKKADEKDVTLANRVFAVVKEGDGAAFDRALRSPEVQDLFRAGILFLART